jgi:hypothetical protein
VAPVSVVQMATQPQGFQSCDGNEGNEMKLKACLDRFVPFLAFDFPLTMLSTLWNRYRSCSVLFLSVVLVTFLMTAWALDAQLVRNPISVARQNRLYPPQVLSIRAKL